jgi:hypothetical protein
MKALTIIIKFIIRNCQLLHTGLGAEKIMSSFKLATVPAIFVTVIEGFSKWYIVNQWFMVFVFVAIIIDHILGSIVHRFWKKDWSNWENLKGLLIKLGASIFGYAIFIMIHEILKDVPFVAQYFKVVIQLMVFIYPAGSALGNLSIMTGGKLPSKGLIDRIKGFQDNLELDNFKQKGNENNTDNS